MNHPKIKFSISLHVSRKSIRSEPCFYIDHARIERIRLFPGVLFGAWHPTAYSGKVDLNNWWEKTIPTLIHHHNKNSNLGLAKFLLGCAACGCILSGNKQTMHARAHKKSIIHFPLSRFLLIPPFSKTGIVSEESKGDTSPTWSLLDIQNVYPYGNTFLLFLPAAKPTGLVETNSSFFLSFFLLRKFK